jgi:hypothetical protein
MMGEKSRSGLAVGCQARAYRSSEFAADEAADLGGQSGREQLSFSLREIESWRPSFESDKKSIRISCDYIVFGEEIWRVASMIEG